MNKHRLWLQTRGASSTASLATRRWLWLLLTMVTVVACVTGSEVPQATSMHLLQPKLGQPAAAPQDAFSIVHFGPRGESTSDGVITVVFSKPLRVLNASDTDTPVPISIAPAIAGKWQWVGTNGLQFQPVAGKLPLGQEVTVVVAQTARSIDGDTLKEAHTFAFSTPTPRVDSHAPYDGATGLALDTRVVLDFDQPVILNEVGELVRLRAGDTVLPFTVRPAEENPQRRVVLVPSRPLPHHTQIRVEVPAGLHSVGGNLASPHTKSFSFHTYGPLQATVSCGWSDCRPQSSVSVQLTNRVRAGDLKRLLSISPAVPLGWPSWYDENDMIEGFGFDPTTQPRTTYQVTIAPGLVDEFGQNLQGPTTFSFRTGDYWDSLSVGVQGETLEPRALRSVPIRSRNVASYRVGVAPATPDFAIGFQDRPWENPISKLSGSAWSQVNPGLTNRYSDHLVDLSRPLSTVSDGAKRGLVAMQASYQNRDSYPVTDQRLIQVTDIGLTAKLSALGTLVWVTRLSTGQPLPQATVELWQDSQATHSLITDQNGLAFIPPEVFTPQFYQEEGTAGIVARYQDDLAVQSVRSFLGPWRMPIAPQLYPETPLTLFLFTERGVYRPGDSVWIKGIAREQADQAGHGANAGGMTVVRGRRFRVVLNDANGKQVLQRTVTSNDFGTFAEKVNIPASAALGQWQVEVSPDDDTKQNLRGTSFSVAEYEPAEFKVAATAAKKSYVNGAIGGFEASAEFLFGAPVANSDLHYTLSYEPAAFKPPHSEDFDTSDSDYANDVESQSASSGLLKEGDAKLDPHGSWQLNEPLVIKAQNEPKRVRFEASVTDVSRKTLSGSAQTLVHPGDYYLGLKRPSDWFVAAPATVQPQIVALTPGGKPITGRRVEVQLIRRRWTSVRQQWDGGYRQVYQRVDDNVSHCALTTAAAVQSCGLALTEAGAYLVRAKSTDGGGRVVYASQEFYAIGQGRVSWRDDAENATVELVANKQKYQVGETARVLVKSPFARAEALVTIERAGIIDKRRVLLTGGTPTIDIPITEALRPNAYVSVHLLKQRDAKGDLAQAGDELYRVGYTELRLDASQRRLAVQLLPQRKSVRPRETVVADLVVRDASGKPKQAEVTVYAVDEGVLMLTGYQLPDPVGRFTAPRALRVATLESRANLARILEPQALLGSEKGAEGGGGGEARSDFKQSAYFNPTLVTDAQGRARISFAAPDNLTTFRLMAVAVSNDDRYGSGASQVVVNKPLMARPALPRFLRAGDKFQASVVVSTKDSKSRTVDVSLDVGGGLVRKSERTQRVQVTPTGVVELRFDVEAPTATQATLKFTAQSVAERDVVQLLRTVQSPAQLETVAAYGETKGVEGQRLGQLDQVRGDMGGLDVTLASTRLVGLDGGMDQLIDYPYLCTEQLASRLLPLLPLKELATAFGFEPPKHAQRFVETTVGSILKRQRSDGGFGFWTESLESHPFLSAYALWVLKLAEQHGAEVPQSAYDRGVTYLRAIVNHPTSDEAELRKHQLSRDVQAFASLVLATLDQPDLGAIERLAEQRAEIGLLGHAWLVMAAVAAKAPPELREPLVERLESSITLDGNRAVVENADGWYLDSLLSSQLKVQALVLSALLSHNSQHPLAGKLVAELLQRREGGAWRTTQESAFALLAIDAYWRAQESDTPRFDATVWVGDSPLFRQKFRGRDTHAVVQHVDMTALRAAGSLDVIFQRTSPDLVPALGTLFYEARLNYAARQLPTVPLDRGFTVQKRVRAVQPAQLEAALAVLGPETPNIAPASLAIVDLIVVAPGARRFVVIDDPLPAGLTAFDSTLSTSAERIGELEGTAVRATGFSSAWYRRELRDDRALFFVDEMPAGMYHYRYLARANTPGTYVVPPTQVKEMYQPEVYGRTAARSLVVQAAGQ